MKTKSKNMTLWLFHQFMSCSTFLYKKNLKSNKFAFLHFHICKDYVLHGLILQIFVEAIKKIHVNIVTKSKVNQLWITNKIICPLSIRLGISMTTQFHVMFYEYTEIFQANMFITWLFLLVQVFPCKHQVSVVMGVIYDCIVTLPKWKSIKLQ
jgi:hypothetical protein